MVDYQRWTKRLKGLRRAHGLRQQDVASRIRLSRSQYCALENGKSIANYTHLYRLAKAFRITMAELVTVRRIRVAPAAPHDTRRS